MVDYDVFERQRLESIANAENDTTFDDVIYLKSFIRVLFKAYDKSELATFFNLIECDDDKYEDCDDYSEESEASKRVYSDPKDSSEFEALVAKVDTLEYELKNSNSYLTSFETDTDTPVLARARHEEVMKHLKYIETLLESHVVLSGHFNVNTLLATKEEFGVDDG